jgi:hypothetical protein
MSDVRQTNFDGGEISPLLHGRTDSPLFGKSLRQLLNFFITKHGAAASRPGTTYVNTTKFPTPDVPRNISGAVVSIAGEGTARLIPFDVSDDESFVLEFGAGYIRFHTLGGTVLDPGTGLPYEKATPYAVADLPLLKWAQMGEILTIVSPNWDPYDLRHVADSPPTWNFAKTQVTPPSPWFVDVANQTVGTSEPLILCGTNPGDLGAVLGHVGTIGVVDADHPAKPWVWKVTAEIQNDRTGEILETLPVTIAFKWKGITDPTNFLALPAEIPVYPDMPVTIVRQVGAPFLVPAFGADTFTVLTYNYYRGRGELFGYLGSSSDIWFQDVGDVPRYDVQPPAGRNPFGKVQTVNAWGTDNIHQQRPSSVAYFQQRLVFGGMGTVEREQDLEFSAQGNFGDFDKHNLIDVSGEALQVSVVARRRNRIRHLMSLQRLLILGNNTNFHGGGTQQLPLDYNAMDFPVTEEVGAADVPPLSVDATCLFIRTLGRGVHALVPDQDGFGYQGSDIGLVAEHLFRGLSKTVVDWAHAREPWDTVWAARADGLLLSLTFNRGLQMTAWARHQFGTDADPALVESVCSVRERDEDAVYLIILRTINGVQKRYIERMTSRHERGGAQVGGGGIFGGAGKLLVPPDYICLDCALQVTVNGDLPTGPVQAINGLGYLEGKEVMVLAQGQPPLGPFTVTSGSITLDAPLTYNVTGADGTRAVVAYVGLVYTCDMELLDIAGGQARTKMKQVTHVGFETDASRGVQVGQDFQHLDPQPEREPADGYNAAPLVTDIYYVPVQGALDYKARAVLRQSLPLPCTVVGITRRVESGP